MPVAVQSTSNQAWASATSTTVTKPSGLVVGDLLLAIIPFGNGGGVTITTPAGWTAIRQTDGNGSGVDISVASFYIIATSTEVAASNFTFNISSTQDIAGLLHRIDGFPTGAPIFTSNGALVANTQNPTLANTVTPAIADSLILMSFACVQGNGTLSGYAIATSSPTWTESADLTTTDGPDYSFGAAYATRTQTTATGNSSASFTGAATADWVGQLIVVAPSKDTTTTDTITETDSVFASLGAILSDIITSTDSLTATVAMVWNRVTKTITSWIFPSKS